MNHNEAEWTRSVSDAVTTLLATPLRVGTILARGFSEWAGDGCEIPTPCWLPQPAGRCELTLTQGGTALVRLHVTNCDWRRHTIVVSASGRLAGWVAIDPTTQVLDPQETGMVLVTVRCPRDAEPGTTVTGPIVIYGCNVHVARLSVRVTRGATCAACDLCIEDCPDPIHHWYDHFYCFRPCWRAAEGAAPADVVSKEDWPNG